jgi:hypothetical protein
MTRLMVIGAVLMATAHPAKADAEQDKKNAVSERLSYCSALYMAAGTEMITRGSDLPADEHQKLVDGLLDNAMTLLKTSGRLTNADRATQQMEAFFLKITKQLFADHKLSNISTEMHDCKSRVENPKLWMKDMTYAVE